MKKLMALFTVILTGIGFASCTGTTEESNLEQMTSKESLATLSYLSSGFLSLEDESQVQTTKLSLEKQAVVENELEDVNKYVSLLKSFIDNGPDNFAKIEDQESDRQEYDYLLNMSVNDNEFKLYYNVNIQTREITGIFIIDGVEYEIVAHSNLDDFGDFEEPTTDESTTETEEPTTDESITEESITEESTTKTEEPSTEESTTEESTTNLSVTLLNDDDDEDDEYDEDDEDEDEDIDEYNDDEDDEDDNEIKKEMTLLAKNGEDTITINYEFKSEEDEEKTEFEIIKNINNVESIIEVEIKIEEDEYKLEILDGDNYYEFSMENEDDEVEYELEYEVNGVEGEIEINEYTDELGNVYYEYEIEEEGKQSRHDMEDEFDRDEDDDDEDDEDNEDDEDENDSTEDAIV